MFIQCDPDIMALAKLIIIGSGNGVSPVQY